MNAKGPSEITKSAGERRRWRGQEQLGFEQHQDRPLEQRGRGRQRDLRDEARVQLQQFQQLHQQQQRRRNVEQTRGSAPVEIIIQAQAMAHITYFAFVVVAGQAYVNGLPYDDKGKGIWALACA